VARWASSAALPLEVTIAVSGEEVRARLASGRPFSVLLADATHPGLDADLVAAARTHGCATFVVDDGRALRDWTALGASATLPALFDRATLAAALEEHVTALDDLAGVVAAPSGPIGETAGGTLVAVLGAGGAGASTVARALAQGLARPPGADVVLADLALHADQAMAHDVGDVVPGLQELVEAHRLGHLDGEAVRELTFGAEHLGYRVLLGLRRHRDWTVLRERSTSAALIALRRAFATVVADVEGDLEGETETGSADIEDRNRLARNAVSGADLVVATARADLRGLHRMARLVVDVRGLGVDGDRILPVLVGAPRRPDRRAAHVRAVHELTADQHGTPIRPPALVPWRSDVTRAVLDGSTLPSALVTPLARAAQAVLDALPPRTAASAEPEVVAPGTLGGWWPAGEVG
jgi:hypothetical protein